MSFNLKGKNILFISPSFFCYEIEIKNKIEELGGKVFFIDDRPNNSTLTKALIRTRFGRNLIKKKLSQYFSKKLNEWQHIDFNYVFVNTPETFTNVDIINIYKKKLINVPFVLYMWDSLNNRKSTVNVLCFFDRVFTFDEKDAKLYNLNFRPLFYIDKYVGSNLNIINHDLCFIGTAHTDRYLFVKKIMKKLDENLKTFTYFYLQNPLLYIYNKLFNKEFRVVSFSDLNFKSLNSDFVAEKLKTSKVIIDIHHPKQTGLTMRTIEVLGAKRKLVTTNSDIKKYDFYCKNNILVVDRENPEINQIFFELPYTDVSQKIYSKYSLKGWIEEIFS